MSHKKYDLSLIIVSNRPKWLANCLAQWRRQELGGLRVEVQVIVEGEPSDFSTIQGRYQEAIFHYKPVEGLAGAYGKDLGISVSSADYVCFWDDDNVYYPNALRSIFEVSRGADIGIARVLMMEFGFKAIPKSDEINYGDIDTMCLCVKRILAKKERWSDHQGKGTDYHWVSKLTKYNPSIRFANVEIGEHLNEEHYV